MYEMVCIAEVAREHQQFSDSREREWSAATGTWSWTGEPHGYLLRARCLVLVAPSDRMGLHGVQPLDLDVPTRVAIAHRKATEART